MTFAELRQLYKLAEGENFECQRKNEEIIPVALEDQYPISFDELDKQSANFDENAPQGGISSKWRFAQSGK